MKILLIITLIIILLILILINKNEYLQQDVQVRKKVKPAEIDIITETNTEIIEQNEYSSLIPSNKIKQGSDQFNDTVFNDVKMFIGDRTLGGELGLEKCIKGCDGMCVEYGLTGDAFCFPKKEPNEMKFTQTINTELENKFP